MKAESRSLKQRWRLPLLSLVAAGGVVAGVGALNTWLSWRAGALENQLEGKGRFYHWLRGAEVYNIFYSVAGEGSPVVLLHGIDAAASSYEMRHVFAGLRETHTVYALDLLGFGLSDRPGRTYTTWDYLDLIEDFLRNVVQGPAAVVASGLTAAYAVTIAARSPDLVNTLALICPTGLERLADTAPAIQQRLGGLLRRPILGSSLFNLLVSRAALGYFLKERTYADSPAVTPEVLDAYYRTSHQDGARHAPAAFLSGALNLSIRKTYPALRQPVIILWGREARVIPVTDANRFIHARPQSRLQVIDGAGLLPHVERPEEVLPIIEATLIKGEGRVASDDS